MKTIQQPKQWKVCGDPDHWVNMLLFNECFKCKRELALAADLPKQEPWSDAEIDGLHSLLKDPAEHECKNDEDGTGDCSHPSHDFELIEQERSESESIGHRNAH
jgi:hypothetical protein